MLSGETAVGKYPRQAVEMMSRIVVEAESGPFRRRIEDHQQPRPFSIPEAICEAIAHAARDLNIRAIAVFTESGNTARLLSKYQPEAHIVAFTASDSICNRMNLLWGVTPLRCEPGISVEQMGRFAETEMMRLGVLAPGDVFGLIAGTTHPPGATNFLRLITAGASLGDTARTDSGCE
jgi:pyruvate kinase